MKEKQKPIDAQKKKKSPKPVLDAIALATGVASIVLSILSQSQTPIAIDVCRVGNIYLRSIGIEAVEI